MSAPVDWLENSRALAATLAPGLLLTFTVATAAQFLGQHYGAPSMLFALLLGMGFHFLSFDANCVAGIQFTASYLLRLGVALLGVKVTIAQISSLGSVPLVLTPVFVASTIFFGVMLASTLGRGWRFGLLTGGAVAICGASAALAISSALNRETGSEHDTLFTVIAVTSLSTVAMIFYPVLFATLGFGDTEIGMLIGLTIHDVAQVVGAGYAVSSEAGDVATYVKLLRVSMLPIVIIVIALARRGAVGAVGSFPWFVVVFSFLLVANSFGLVPEVLRYSLEIMSRWLLVAAIAAMGIKTSIKAMTELGMPHLLTVVGETLFLAAIAITAIRIL